jgi:hypothetical protein
MLELAVKDQPVTQVDPVTAMQRGRRRLLAAVEALAELLNSEPFQHPAVAAEEELKQMAAVIPTHRQLYVAVAVVLEDRTPRQESRQLELARTLAAALSIPQEIQAVVAPVVLSPARMEAQVLVEMVLQAPLQRLTHSYTDLEERAETSIRQHLQPVVQVQPTAEQALLQRLIQ